MTHMHGGALCPLHDLGELLPRRVAVFRALQLGDMLCAVPALRALRAALPDAETVLVGLPWARWYAERFGRYLDGFHEFPGYPGLPERPPQPARIPAFLAEMQRERFDLAIQLHGSGVVSNPLTVLFGARRTVGFYQPPGYCPDAESFFPYPDRGLEVHRLLSLLEHLGIPPQGEALEFPLNPDDSRALAGLPGAEDLEPGGYVCVHPGASVPERRWPAERFAAVADALAARGLGVVLTGTTGEAGLTRRVGWGMKAAYLDLVGRTDLGTLGALLQGARLLVCNDTGVSHVAAALRVPSVVISTGNNPERWAPADRQRHRVLCRDDSVSTDEVIEQAEDLLDEPPAPWSGPPTVCRV
jgi:ADP-heptose:LPS heptosyltransferase